MMGANNTDSSSDSHLPHDNEIEMEEVCNTNPESHLVEMQNIDEESKEKKNVHNKQKLTFVAAWPALLAAFAGCYQYGFSLGSVNAAFIPMRASIQQYHMLRYNQTISTEELDLLWVFIAASFPIGGLFGCFLVNMLVQKCGKMRSMVGAHVLTLIASLMLGLSDTIQSYELIIIARVIVGISSSTAGTGISPMYIVEIIPTQWRGTFGACVGLAISSSLVLSNILGLQQILGTEKLWPLFLSFTGIPSLIFICLYYFMPESPRTLYISKNNKEAAENLLKKLRNSDDVSMEIGEMAKEALYQKSHSKFSVWKLLRSPKLRRQVIACMVIASAQQVTGLNGVVIYMNQLYVKAGISEEQAPYFGIVLPCVMMTMSILLVFLVKKKGRRPLLIAGYFLEGIFLILLMVTVKIQHVASWTPYLSIVFASGFVIAFNLGPGPVTLFIAAEFFFQAARSSALTISGVCLWSGFSLVVIIWPYLQKGLGAFAYIPFAVLAFSTSAFLYISVPETRGRSFLEIQKDFQSRKLPCTSPSDGSSIKDSDGTTTTSSVMEQPHHVQ